MAALTIEQAFQVALAHHQAGRLAEAEAIYRQILAVDPRHVHSLHYLGVSAHQMGRTDVAVDLITKSITISPSNAEAHSNLAIALLHTGQLDGAIAACRQALALRPDYAKVHNLLGTALKDKGQLDGSIAAYRQAIALQPNYPEAHSNLGVALQTKGQLGEAIAAYRQAIALKPDLPEVSRNLGTALQANGQLDEAIVAFRQATAVNPSCSRSHFSLALALLLQGNFAEGWQEHEWQWKLKDVVTLRQNCTQPQWDGGRLEGRTILLYAEQGFGDALQFIRFLPMVQERGGKVAIECQQELQRLFQTMMPGLPVVGRGQPLPPFDVHCPLSSLAPLFATDLTNIPRNVPYLHANAAAVGVWRERLTGHPSCPKIGLVWAGNPANTNDRNRSMKLAALAPLAEVPGLRFFSLQKADAATEAKTPPPGMELADVTEELKDFADTAALIANLDLVIAVDTAVVHLAGAMGKPVWTLLAFSPDWRWLLGREDSPWYPTMRLFRQPAIGDWDSVIRRVTLELAAWRP